MSINEKDFSDPIWEFDFGEPREVRKMTVKYDPTHRDSYLQFFDNEGHEVRNVLLPVEPKKGSFQAEKFHPNEKQ